jgi:hypothetical protein
LDGSIVVALLAGAAGGAMLFGGRALSMRVDPRPCWDKNDCALKRANPEACHGCPVYLFRDVPVEEFVTRELNLPPLRSFEPEEAVPAA